MTDALLRAPDPEKQANQPGIVVYLAGEGETLWDICKKYDVPMDGMREMNNLTQDEPSWRSAPDCEGICS